MIYDEFTEKELLMLYNFKEKPTKLICEAQTLLLMYLQKTQGKSSRIIAEETEGQYGQYRAVQKAINEGRELFQGLYTLMKLIEGRLKKNEDAELSSAKYELFYDVLPDLANLGLMTNPIEQVEEVINKAKDTEENKTKMLKEIKKRRKEWETKRQDTSDLWTSN